MDDRPLPWLWRRNTLQSPVTEPLFSGCPPHPLATTMELSGIRTQYDASFITGPVIHDTSVLHAYMTSWLHLAKPQTPHDTVARSTQGWYWTLHLISLACWQHGRVFGVLKRRIIFKQHERREHFVVSQDLKEQPAGHRLFGPPIYLPFQGA